MKDPKRVAAGKKAYKGLSPKQKAKRKRLLRKHRFRKGHKMTPAQKRKAAATRAAQKARHAAPATAQAPIAEPLASPQQETIVINGVAYTRSSTPRSTS